jgi:arabinan endo-1,5-alpha-L-arabinosidase
MHLKNSKHVGLLTVLFGAVAILITSYPTQAQTSGSNGSHDPSRMIEDNGKLYVWSTGAGGKVSTDGLVWATTNRLPFGGWVDSLSPSNQGMWAPDGIFYHGLYWLFYTVCNTHDNTNQGSCGNGLWTTPTLDPQSPNYKLTDRGLINRNVPSDNWAGMDPAPFIDLEDNLWFIYGGGGWVTRLDNTTGKVSPLQTTLPGYHLLPSQKGEANYIHYRAPYWYFFWNTGGCCNGITSTYVIHMARSKTLTGGYNINDNKIFYGSGPHTTGGINGPGHIGISNVCGTEVFTYHYYPTGQSVLGVNYLTWSSDGWPVAGGQITAPLKPCGTKGTGVHPGSNSLEASGMKINTLSHGISIQLPESKFDRQLNVAILSLSGKSILSAPFHAKSGRLDISDRGLTTGIYTISITEKGKSILSSRFALME